MVENRFFSRFPVKGSFLFQPLSGKPRTIKANPIDFSFKGMAVYTQEPLQKGEAFRFLLVSKETDIRMSGSCKVVYSQPSLKQAEKMYRIAIEFVYVDSDNVRDAIDKLKQATEGFSDR